MASTHDSNRYSDRYINLASTRLGAAAVFASDEFFAPCERMLEPQAAVFVPGKYDDHGKWMDGWESRRKRVAGHDYCIVRLGLPGTVRGVDIDTSHFIGNHPPAASIDGCWCPDADPDETTPWTEILPSVSLAADSHHLHDIAGDGCWTHLRLNIYPDGGVARLRVYGEPLVDWSRHEPSAILDLAAVAHGGRAIACSGEAFGSSMHNLTLPGRGRDMGDGWETARRREPGNDWVILALGHAGTLQAIELDTAHYKGNFPDRASAQAACVRGGTVSSIVTQSMFWPILLPEQKLEMDAVHRFETQVQALGPVTHVRINIIPDGGLSRVRLYGCREIGR